MEWKGTASWWLTILLMMADDGALLVLNPASSLGRDLAAIRRILSELSMQGLPVRPYLSRSLADVSDVVAGTSDGQLVIVGGGDGTVGAACAAALRSGAVIAPLSGGRGNDLCRAIGIPVHPVAAAATFSQRRRRRLDVAQANNHPFVTAVTVGLPTQVNALANELRWLGRAGYLVAAFRLILRARPVPLRIVADGEVVADGPVWLAVAGNGRTIGAGLPIAPRAQTDDGRLELVVMTGPGRWRLMVGLPALILHLNHLLAFVEMRSVRSTTWSAPGDQPVLVYGDGEPMTTTPMQASVVGSIEVLAPPAPARSQHRHGRGLRAWIRRRVAP